MSKLINTEELRTLSLTKPAQDELTAQVINQLKSIADPLVRYATANALKKVFDAATSDAGAAAVAYCHEHNLGQDNTMFEHEGLNFILDYRCAYRWADNDFKTDKDGNVTAIGFRSAEKALAECMKVSEMWKTKIKAAKAEIELLHPQMDPINPTWIIKFLMKEL